MASDAPADHKHDRLTPGVARLAAGVDEDDGAHPVRIVPIPEGETTTGLSGTPTHWPRETLKRAVDAGVWQGAKLLKSPGGPGHKEMEALADPDNIIGQVTDVRYEEGVGPVLKGNVIDEHMARLVDHGLVGVSPDLYRELGEFDDQLGAAPATDILDVPYITILDRGASEGATIEPARAEALAASDAGQFLQSGTSQPDDERSEVPGDGADGSDSSDDSDSTARTDGADGEQTDPANEPAESGVDPNPDTDPDPDTMSDDDKLEELREQLAAAKADQDDKAERIESLESDTEDLKEQLSAKDETITEKDERIETLEAENRVVREVIAEHAAGDSSLSPERLAEKFDTEELAEMLAEGDDDDDDDGNYLDTVREQLAAAPAHRGQTPDDDDPANLDEEQLAAADTRARSVLALDDVRAMDREQLSPREYVKRTHDVDPATYDSAQSLREAIQAQEAE